MSSAGLLTDRGRVLIGSLDTRVRGVWAMGSPVPGSANNPSLNHIQLHAGKWSSA